MRPVSSSRTRLVIIRNGASETHAANEDDSAVDFLEIELKDTLQKLISG